ncbi:MAG: type II secretion system F family protein, partial [Spirochaetales bacterium]|nr:type II secretion system F family protein [Spirochaetales bacterium]
MKPASKFLRMIGRYFPIRKGGRRKDAIGFIRKLSVLLNSGVSVNKALRMIAKGHQLEGDHNSYGFVNMLSRGIEEGRSLYEVLGIQSRHFDTMTLSLIKVGEESGQLHSVLIKILEYHDKQVKYRKKLKQAMTYPIIVVVIASLTVVFLTYFLLPMFGEMYHEMDMELPGFTRTLLAISEHGGFYLTTIFGITIVTSLGVKRLSKIPAVNQRIINGIRKAPFFGDMTRKFVTMYYSQILATLLESGLTLLHGLEICQQISRKGHMQQFFGYIIKTLKEGRSFSDSLTETAMW